MVAAVSKQRKPDNGPEWFQKAFAKAAHKDDWGVECMYGYAAWRLVKLALRRQRMSDRRIPTPS
jgi:hypothetical protein